MKPVALLAEGVDRNAQDDVDLVGLRRSPSSRRAWIEIGDGRNDRFGGGSPSSRRAWIEIGDGRNDRFGGGVALLAEGVDRNLCYPLNDQIAVCVALLAEGVDRNNADGFVLGGIYPSPSSRRAWIEICRSCAMMPACRVALLAEGVDRNQTANHHGRVQRSPSSRRAWIEITTCYCCLNGFKSPSSRRAWIEIGLRGCSSRRAARRPPRGGRG